jgi:hypothetical protein
MAVSNERAGFLKTVEDPSFFENDRTDCRLFQTQHTRLVVAAAEVSGPGAVAKVKFKAGGAGVFVKRG